MFLINISFEENPDFMISLDWIDYLFKFIFYGNLILNSFTLIILTLVFITINIISIIFPNILNYFLFIEWINEIIFEDEDSLSNEHLNEIELQDLKSFSCHENN
jgi:hypothetical protein